MFPILYVTDKSKFYDTTSNRLLSLETAKLKLQAYDDKYRDAKALDQAVRDIMEAPVYYDEVRRATTAKAKGPTFEQIWEAMQPLVPIYKKLNKSGQSQIFTVAPNNEVSKITYNDDDSLFDCIQAQSTAFEALQEFYRTDEICADIRLKMSFKPFLIKMIKEFCFADNRHIFVREPLQISWDDEEFAFKKMDSSLLKPGKTPTWDEFITRLDYPNVFMAWIWGIFEPTNNIRQVLWLKGAGNDGKSSIQKAIESVIGREYCCSLKPGDEAEKWFQNTVYGKVLVNYADCRNLHLINENNIKQLTGGDTTSIEGKGENAFTAKIYSKVLVTSNYRPLINPEIDAQTTRLIKLDVAPQADSRKDAGFEQRLKAEVYPFLYKCQQYFEELIAPGFDRLLLPTELVERIKIECASETYLNVEDFFQEFITLAPEAVCKPADLKKVAKDYFLLEKRIGSDQYKYHYEELEHKLRRQGCTQIRIASESQEDVKETMWLGLTLKKGGKK